MSREKLRLRFGRDCTSSEKTNNIDQISVYGVVNGKKVYLGSRPPGAALLNSATPSAVSVGAVRGPSCFYTRW